MKFTTFSGYRPTGTHECSEWEVKTLANGQPFVEGHATQDQYILNGKIVDKPSRPSENHTWDWSTAEWVQNKDHAILLAKRKRADLLAESDWTQMPDVSMSTKTQWASYRQALRDITTQAGYPLEIVWPEKP